MIAFDGDGGGGVSADNEEWKVCNSKEAAAWSS